MHPMILYTQAIQSDRERGYESEEHRMLMEASALQSQRSLARPPRDGPRLRCSEPWFGRRRSPARRVRRRRPRARPGADGLTCEAFAGRPAARLVKRLGETRTDEIALADVIEPTRSRRTLLS